MTATLYYIHDPMCSWCWAFTPALDSLLQRLPEGVQLQKLLGGLAPDTDEPMPEEMRQRLQQNWQRIEQNVPGIRFNFDFWSQTTPRRATYPACRALIAARQQGEESAMLEAIQQAYYRQARNPSERATLLQLAGEIGLDRAAFARTLDSAQTRQQLEAEIAQAESLGVDSYPSLVLAIGDCHWPVPVDYTRPDNMLETIVWMLQEAEGGE